jgi:ATP-binding cassette subfamily C protein
MIGLGAFSAVLEAMGVGIIFLLVRAISNPETLNQVPFIDFTASFPQENDSGDLLTIVGFICLFFVGRGAVLFLQTYLINRLALNEGAHLASRLLRSYLNAPYSFHLSRNSSELIRNTHESAGYVASMFLVGALTIASEGMLVLGLIAALAITTPAALLAAVGISLLTALLLKVIQPRLGRLGREYQDGSASSVRWLQQSLHGLREVKLGQKEDVFEDRFREQRLVSSHAQYLQVSLGQLPRVVVESLLLVGLTVVIGASIASGSSEETLVGSVGALGYAAFRLLPSMNRMSTQANNMSYARAALEDVFQDLMQLEQARLQMPQLESSLGVLAFERELAISSVDYCYPGSSVPSLLSIDLRIAKGEAIGFVGRTGAGKSTLFDIILGLLSPTQGDVLVDGRSIFSSLSEWRRLVGVVSQNIYLLDDSFRRNVAFGIDDDFVDEDRLREAIALAQLEEFTASLPAGLDTTLGERGIRLSGGQRQRVAIARALYERPEVLVLDEGTAALDTVTEREIINAVQRFRGEKTVLLAAHRLATVAACDRIVLMDQGRVSEEGTFAELRQSSELFQRMVDL